jgi:hypothetical protein
MRDVQRSGTVITIDSACTVGGKPSTSHVGDYGQLRIRMKVTSQSESGASSSRRPHPVGGEDEDPT